MSKEIKLATLTLSDINPQEANFLKNVQILNTLLDNAEYENATILFMGEFVCVYTSESCKERSAPIADLLFRESEKTAATNILRSQLPFNVSNMSIDNIVDRIIDLGYRQIVQS